MDSLGNALCRPFPSDNSFDVEGREMAPGIGTGEVPQRLVIEITVNLWI